MKQILLISFLVCSLVSCNNSNGVKSVSSENLPQNDSNKTTVEKTEKKVSFTCEDLIQSVTDKVTGKSRTQTAESIFVSSDQETGFSLYLMVTDSKTLVFNISVLSETLRCVDEGDEANILFRDGSRLTLKSAGDFNCEGSFTVYFGDVFGKKKELRQLMEKEIETMRVWGRGKEEEQDFSEEDSKRLLTVFKCLGDMVK